MASHWPIRCQGPPPRATCKLPGDGSAGGRRTGPEDGILAEGIGLLVVFWRVGTLEAPGMCTAEREGLPDPSACRNKDVKAQAQTELRMELVAQPRILLVAPAY